MVKLCGRVFSIQDCRQFSNFPFFSLALSRANYDFFYFLGTWTVALPNFLLILIRSSLELEWKAAFAYLKIQILQNCAFNTNLDHLNSVSPFLSELWWIFKAYFDDILLAYSNFHDQLRFIHKKHNSIPSIVWNIFNRLSKFSIIHSQLCNDNISLARP